MQRTWPAILTFLLLLSPTPVLAKKSDQTDPKDKKAEEPKKLLSAETLSGLELRSIGPALTSGRIGDVAVDARDPATWFVAVASGGVWKTTNAGTTFEPVFDGEGSYSIGCVTLDPNDSNVVWVGTGENNSQRSVGYGDGVYKSTDAGKSWKRMGLEKSEHVGKIVVDPRDSRTVYVAAQGPLWAPGGDRGLYKTTDGGASWQRVLDISENTGVSDLVFDPRNPDVLFASAYQRRRHVWTLIDGGPEGAIHKSTDAGKTWRKLSSGLPKGDVGRIGLAISPPNPDVVYAIVEAAGKDGGFFRSTDRGETWEKRSDYVSGSPQYYQEIIADPENVDLVYSNDVWIRVTHDGGKNFSKLPGGEWNKHVDNHSIWIDPRDTEHLLAGCDGGLYESFDRGATWRFFPNLPVTQFYKVAVDNAVPFYNVYGGTQDNFSLGGASRTATAHGITNDDWYITLGGDGFQTQVDPEDPNTVYSQAQHGELARFDKVSGEAVDIKPQAAPGEAPLRWNWDAPLLISPHLHTRLYFGANVLYRSDDRGSSWKAVSGDLTRQIDRNQLEVMGEVWSIDAVAKNNSTSFYGNLVALDESPRVEGLLYVGTDDGLVHVSANGGEEWRKIESFPGVPERTYVNDLAASPHAESTIYAAFNNHKKGDFKPYLLKSTDRGTSWRSIAGDLPERGSVYAVVEDPVKPDLLFAGTEFGVFFTLDGGGRWIELEGGMPTIAVRDLAIQKRENDLVVATFGRGFYVLDDYSSLRQLSEERLGEAALLFPVRETWMFIPSKPLGLTGNAFQGDAFYSASNPPHGAVFTYYLKDGLTTLEKARQKREKELREKKEKIVYPSWDELRVEEREEDPVVLLVVRDGDGNVVRRIEGPTSAGFHRIAWDLRYSTASPINLSPPPPNRFSDPPAGPLAAPGTYTVELTHRVKGKVSTLAAPQSFVTKPLGTAQMARGGGEAFVAFQKKVARLQRALFGAVEAMEETTDRITHLKKAIDATPEAAPELADRVRALESRLQDLRERLTGDDVIGGHNEPTPPAITERLDRVIEGFLSATAAPTTTQEDAYRIAGEAFENVLADLTQLIETDLEQLEADLEAAGGPWTPGRVPRWQRE